MNNITDSVFVDLPIDVRRKFLKGEARKELYKTELKTNSLVKGLRDRCDWVEHSIVNLPIWSSLTY